MLHMWMTIRYQDGTRFDAVVLAASRERMRVAVNSQRDTLELRKLDSGWRTEKGEEIEIEALIPIGDADVSRFCAEIYPLTSAAR